MNDEVLRLEALGKTFGSHEVLRGVDLTVKRGETVCLVGASGCGKSTLLRCVNFLETPTTGRIYFEGELVGRETNSRGQQQSQISYKQSELTRLRSKIGMVFQQFNLFPHLTVEQNVMLAPMQVRGMNCRDAEKLALKYLEKVGIADKRSSFPAKLSGGQQQRVAIARALAMEPAVMLFDEATSALDPQLVGEVLLVMKQLAIEGVTMVVVTHELGFAYNVAHRVLYLDGGQIYEQGTPDEVLIDARRPRTRQFLKGVTTFRLPETSTSGDSEERSPQLREELGYEIGRAAH